MTTTDLTPARRMHRPAWLVVAGAELRLLLRNRTALLTATATPLAFGALLLLVSGGDGEGIAAGAAELAGTQLIMLLGFTIYATATMTLASRRQQLFLKRLRASPASTTGIVTGLTAPLVGLLVAQTAAVFTATAVMAGVPPARPALLVLAALVGCLTCAGLAFLTAAFTRTPEAAQFTTFPGFILLVGGLVWVNITPPAEVTPLMLAVPGAAVAQLTRYGWDGPLPAGAGLVNAVAPALLASLVVAVAAGYVATRVFRWEPRL